MLTVTEQEEIETAKELAEEKTNKKIELDTYVSGLTESDYTADNWNKIKDILAKAKTDIEAITLISQIEPIVTKSKTDIDEVLTVAEQEEIETAKELAEEKTDIDEVLTVAEQEEIETAKELAEEKTDKKTELDTYIRNLATSEYSQNNWDKISAIVADAKKKIEETTLITDIAPIVTKAKSDIDSVPTKKEETKEYKIETLEKDIESLPDPDTATDEIIMDNKENISDAKEKYDELGTDVKDVNNQSVKKLEKLISRLSNVKVTVNNSGTVKVEVEGLELLVDPDKIQSGIEAVEIVLKVDDVIEKISKDQIEYIKSFIGDKTLGGVLDINITKIINGTDEENITEVPNGVKIRIAIPDGLKGKKDYVVVRMHNGELEYLDTVVDGDYLEFYTDKFSLYSIVYSEVENEAVKTGDHDITPLMIMMIISMLTVFATKKRIVNSER